MELKVDVGISSICKNGEEVCGDTTQVINTKDSTTVILSDGLGSGIKASILSILSTRIAARLLKENIGLEQVFETIAGTLPICRVRDIAYSTLSILKVDALGMGHLIEYDNPSLMIIRNNELLDIEKVEREIAGKKVYEAFFELEKDDTLLMISDGIINAGVGGLFKLGLGQDRLLKNIFKNDWLQNNPYFIADHIIGITEAYYQGKPGDDSTCVVIKAREPRKVVVITGPPAEDSKDHKVVDRFISNGNQQVICGGATGNMVARVLDKKLETSLEYVDPSVPPIGYIEGIDLVTEGILTLNKAFEIIQTIDHENFFSRRIELESDGASRLVDVLMNADKITILMGTAVNPAHKELMQSLQLKPRPSIVGKMVNILRNKGKDVEMEVF